MNKWTAELPFRFILWAANWSNLQMLEAICRDLKRFAGATWASHASVRFVLRFVFDLRVRFVLDLGDLIADHALRQARRWHVALRFELSVDRVVVAFHRRIRLRYSGLFHSLLKGGENEDESVREALMWRFWECTIISENFYGNNSFTFCFMRRFWNQIFTCVSFRPRLCAISIRRALVRYLFVQNSFSNSVSCLVVKFVRPVLLVLLWKASCWSLLIRLFGGGSLCPSFITSWPPFCSGKSDCRATAEERTRKWS